MARPQVAIRLATEGKAQVQRDFADIADAGSAQAQRLRAKWESETDQIGRLTERAARTAERLAAASVTPMQSRIGAATGIGAPDQTGAARASAKALADELDRAEREAHQLIAAIDPLFAAQSRYSTQVDRINGLKRLGVIDEQRYQQLLMTEKGLLDQATNAQIRHGASSGQMRMGMQQLGFQLNDVSTQFALGTRASVIFAQQSGQVIQAMQLMGGEGNAFLKFLGGPWGIVLASAAVVMTPLIAKLLETKDSIGDLIDKMKEEDKQTELGRQAKERYRQSEEGLAAAVRDRLAAMKDSVEAEKSQGERDNLLAQTAINSAIATRESTKALLEHAQALLRNAQATTFGAGGGAGAAGAVAFYSEQQAQLEAELTKNQAAMIAAQALLSKSRIELAAEAAKIAADPAAKINKTYDDLVKAAKAASGEIKNLTLAQADNLATSLLGIEKQRKAALKALEDGKRTNAGGTAIFDAQIGAYFDTADKYRGKSEHADRGVLEAFFREANIAIDPEKTAWCAAFVNAVLHSNGVAGTGSLAASSFLNFGKDDMRSPQRGDIVVVKSSGSASGQHVGLLDSIDAKGNVRVLGGNTGDKVGTGVYGKKDVLAIRRPPTPSESAKSDSTAADHALDQINRFEEQRARLNEQLLAALGETVAGYQAQSDAAALQVHAEHDRLALAIQNDLEEGKYGAATSDTAKARAAELTAINDGVEAQKLANLALRDRLHDAAQADDVAARETGYRLEGLEYQDEIARTAGEHRDAQLEILDLVYQEKQRHLEYLKAQAELVGNTEEAARIQDEINHLPEQKGRDQDRARRATRSPGEDYLASLPQSMADLNEQLQHIEVKGLEDMNKQLADAVTSAESFHDLWASLGEIAHNVAKQMLQDLLDLAIQMYIMKPLAQALFGGDAGGSGGAQGGGGGGVIGTIISGLSAIFGGGGSTGAGGGGSSSGGGGSSSGGSQGFTGPPNAVGTHYFPGGVAWVGEHGPEMVNLPRGSVISTAAESRRMAAANDAGPRVSLTNYNDFRGADSSAVAAIQGRLDQMEAELPSRVVQAYQDARTRFVIR